MENENSYRYVDGNIVYTSVKNPQGLFKYPIGRQGRLSVNGENVTNIDSNKPFINAVDIDWNGAVVDGNIINTTTDLLEWVDSKEGGGGSQGTSEKEYYELINYYLWSETTPATVSTRALLELNGWSTNCPNRPNNNSILWLYYVSVVKDENGAIIKEGRLSGPVPISGVNGSAGEDLVDREYIYLVFRTVLDFGVGNSNPYNWEISNQDDYLGPSGSLWQDHPSGVSNEWPYEYMSWRDKSGNSWGRFHTPILWSHYGVNGMDGDGVEYVFVRTSVDTAPVVSADLPLREDPRADEFLPKVEIVNENGMISGSVASYNDELNNNKKITRCTDNPVGVDSVYRYEWVLQRKTEVRQKILDNGVVVGEEKVWKEYTGTMAKWGVYSGDSLVTIQNGQLFINGTATNIWVEGANGHGVEILNVPDFSPSDPSTWPRNTYVGQLIQCGGHIYVYLNGGWQDLGEAYGAGKYVHIAYADSLTFSGTQITACTGFAVDAGPQPKNWFGIYSDGNELDAGADFPSNVTISENENNPEVYNGETRLDIINKYKWNYTVGKDGNGVEYIYCVSAPGHIPDTPSQSLNVDEYLPIITENHNDVDSRFYNFGVTVTEGGQQVSKWTDDPIVTSESTGAAYTLSPTFPILWWSQRKKVNGVWLAFSKPVEHDTYTTSPEMYSVVSDYSVIKKDGETYTPGSITFTQMYYKEDYAIRTEKHIIGYSIDGGQIQYQDNSPANRTESITLVLSQCNPKPQHYIKVGLYQLPDGNETPSVLMYQPLTIPVMSNGVSYYTKEIYKCIREENINTDKPNNVINPSGWSTNINIVPADANDNTVHLIMYSGIIIDGELQKNSNDEYWSGPYDLGKPNSPGEDGLKYEFIYKRITDTDYNTYFVNLGGWTDYSGNQESNLNITYNPNIWPHSIYWGYVNGLLSANKNSDDWVPRGWTDNPQGVGYVLEGNTTVFYKYEFCAIRTRYKSNVWNSFLHPFVWSVYGEKGTDGDGVEYVFARTKSEDVKPYTVVHSQNEESSFLNIDYLPVIYKIDPTDSSNPPLKIVTTILNDSNTYNGKTHTDNTDIPDDGNMHWSDDPQGVTLEWPVEWVIKRKKVDGEWLDFQSEPAIWAKYGFNSVRLALDNEHEDFLYSGPNSNAPISPSGGATSLAHLYDGSTEITQDITWYVSCNGGSNYSEASDYDTDGSLVKARISSSGLLTVSHIKANSVKVKVKAIYNRLPYYAEFTANKTNLDKYDLKLVPNAIAFNSSDTWFNKTITPSATRTDLLGNVYPADIHNSSSSSNLKLYYDYVKTDGKLYNYNNNGLSLLNSATFTLENDQANNYIGIYFELRLYTSSNTYRLCDYETVEIAKSSNGPAGATFKIIEAYKYGTSTPDANDKPSITTITSDTVTAGNGWYLSMSSAASNAAGATILYVYKAQFLKNATTEGQWDIIGNGWDGPALYSGKNGRGISNITNEYAKSLYVNTNLTLDGYPNDIILNSNWWQSSSPAVDDIYSFLWVKQSIYFDDNSTSVKYYCVGKKGDRGIDAKDVEFVYIRTTQKIAPTIINDSSLSFNVDDFCPNAQINSGYGYIKGKSPANNLTIDECTDDPLGVNETWKYEWEAKRTKDEADNGIRSWKTFYDATENNGHKMVLYNNYAEDSVNVMVSPENLILTLNTTSPYNIDLSNAFVIVSVNKGGTPINLNSYSISITNLNNCLASVDNSLSNRININSINTITLGSTDYYDSGYVSFSVNYNGHTYNKQFNFYVNLLGTWKETVIGDTNKAVAQSLTYAVDPDSGTVENFSHIGEYIRSSKEKVDTISEKVESRNLFGFTKGIGFDLSGYEVIPYIQGYGFEVYKLNGNRIYGSIDNLGMSKEGTYVFSMEVKSNITSTKTFRFLPCYYNIVPIEGLESNGNYKLSTLWKKVAFKVELTQNTLGSSFTSWADKHGYLDIYSNDTYNSGTIPRLYIRKLQIEYGNVPTSFRICKEDENYVREHKREELSPDSAWIIDNNIQSTSPDFNGHTVYTTTNTLPTGNSYWDIKKEYLSFKANTVYTMSFWAKANSNSWISIGFKNSSSGNWLNTVCASSAIGISNILTQADSSPSSYTTLSSTVASSGYREYYISINEDYIWFRFEKDNNIKITQSSDLGLAVKMGYGFSSTNTSPVHFNWVNINNNRFQAINITSMRTLIKSRLVFSESDPSLDVEGHIDVGGYGVILLNLSERNNYDFTKIRLSTGWTKYYIHYYSLKNHNLNHNNQNTIGVIRIDKNTLNHISISDMKIEEGYITSENRSDYSTVVKQTSRSIDMSVLVNSVKKAGLELTTNENGEVTEGVIKATADKFEIQNSNGDTTFSVDEDGNIVGAGNASFGGNISAKSIICAPNTYSAVCIYNSLYPKLTVFDPQTGNLEYKTSLYCIKKGNSDFIEGLYYLVDGNSSLGNYRYNSISEYKTVIANNGEFNDNDSVFISCTGYSDKIICSFYGLGAVDLEVVLPRACDYKGKLIQIKGKGISSNLSLYVKAVDDYVITGGLGTNNNDLFINYNSLQSPGTVTLGEGTYDFISAHYRSDTTKWIWVQL